MSTHEPPYTPHEDDDTTTIDIESAIGWEPPESKKYQRILDQHRRSDKTIWAWNSMLESRPANDWRKPLDGEPLVNKREPADLFGTLWRREGDLAVLAGETGVGKSILAVQIAESIARGHRIEPFRSPGSPPYEGGAAAPLGGRGGSLRRHGPLRGREVLYLDLEHTADQFWQRYTITDGRRRRRYDFSSRNIRTGVRVEFDPPEAFRGNLNEYLFHSIESEIRRSGASVVIIDSLAHIAPTPNRLSATMRTLRLWSAQGNLSILAIANVRTRRQSSPPYQGGVADAPRGRRGGSLRSIELPDVTTQLSALADSVFCLSGSTMREDVRYLKHLKSTSTPITLDHRSVATYQLGRMSGVGTPRSSPTYEGGVAASSADGVVLSPLAPEPTEITGSAQSLVSPHSSLTTHHSSLSPSPFLGLSFVGFSTEESHLRNYAAEAQAQLDAQTKRLNRLKTGSVVNMVMSPEYQRYLKGE